MNTYDFFSGSVGETPEEDSPFLGLALEDAPSTPAAASSGATQGDALYTATQSLLTALTNSTACADSASAATAFQSAYNAAPAIPNTVAPTTGTYDSDTKTALQAAINAYQALSPPVSFTSGSAPPPCGAGAGGGSGGGGGGGGGHRGKTAPVPAPPPVDQGSAALVGPSVDTTTPPNPPAVQPTPAPPVDQTPPPPPPAPVVQTLPPPAPPMVQPPAPPMFVQPPAPPPAPGFLPPPAPPIQYLPQPYVVQQGDSPEAIARRFGIHLHELIRANPHKPVRQVRAGVHTWHTLQHGERLRVPARPQVRRDVRRGRVGDAEVVVTHGATTVGGTDGLLTATQKLLAALSSSPGYPTSVSCLDTNVVVATGVFQRAYNAAPASKIGRTDVLSVSASYDAATANALQDVINKYATMSPPVSFSSGSAASPCTVPSTARMSSPPPAPPPVVSVPTVTRPGVAPSAAAQALAAVNPCDQANAGLVFAFQQSVKIDPDRKYSTDTAKALAALVPGAPPACHPRPAWWGAPQGNSSMRYVAPPAVAPHHVPPPPPMAAAAYVPPGPSRLPPPAPFRSRDHRYGYAPGAYSPVYMPTPGLPDVLEPPPAPVAPVAAATPDAPPPAPVPAVAMTAPQTAPATAPPGDEHEHGDKPKDGISTGMYVAGGVAAVALVGIVAAVVMSGSSKSSGGVPKPAKASEKRRRR